MTLAELRTQIYAMLGTTSSDKAYPPSVVNRWVNDVCNMLYGELPGDYLTTRATLEADGGAGRVYSLATQSTPITNWRQFRDVRTLADDGTQGAQLDERPYSDLEAWQGATYAVYGVDAAVKLETSPSVAEAVDLTALYTYWPTELSDDSHEPSSLPARFHDLIVLEAARLAFAVGSELRWPEVYEDQRMVRYSQFRSHTALRGGTSTMQRVRESGF